MVFGVRITTESIHEGDPLLASVVVVQALIHVRIVCLDKRGVFFGARAAKTLVCGCVFVAGVVRDY